MASMIVLTGRFGTDPEEFGDGNTQRASFRFASSEWEKGEENTDWYSVTCFGRLAERIGRQQVENAAAAVQH